MKLERELLGIPRTTQRHRLTRLQILRQQRRHIRETRHPSTRPETHSPRRRIRLIAITRGLAHGLPARWAVETGRVVVPNPCPAMRGGWIWEFGDGRCRRGQTSIEVHVAGALHAVFGDHTVVVDVSDEESVR